MQATALDGILVVELGHRIASGLAGNLLAQAGAEVVLVEAEAGRQPTKWDHRGLIAGGKLSIARDMSPASERLLGDLLARADVVLTSDLDPEGDKNLVGHSGKRRIVCDISAFGSTGPMAGQTDSDLLVQALSGIMDVTGLPAEAPAPVGLPVTEISAAIYAASAITAALRHRDMGGDGQKIEVSLYDCAINAQSTFLPFHFVGRVPRRVGNRHSMCAPWNCYQASDRWVLICSATNDQWLRLCDVMRRADLAENPALAELSDRLARCDEVDEAVQDWVARRTSAECIDALGDAGLACGAIVPIDALANEPNLAHRSFVRSLTDPMSGQTVAIPASPLEQTPLLGQAPYMLPVPGSGLAAAQAVLARRAEVPPAHSILPPATPLSDVCVLEIGQYTTAPLAARHLATFGADVLKIEPPQGESSRYWPPDSNGQGIFFTLSNSDKHSVMLDLDTEAGRSDFKALLHKADVFVENTKPGSLARRGFGARELAEINPRLIYCAISGFGYRSAYPNRPAFDTVIQAMSGVMDLTRSANIPVKAGISVADILGGEFALLAILLALKHRDRTGKGTFIDLAMQDACAWATQFAWQPEKARLSAVLACADGFVAAEAPPSSPDLSLASADAKSLAVQDVLAELAKKHIPARRVQTVSEAAESPQCQTRQLLLWRRDREGVERQLLASPIRFEKTPALVRSSIGALGSGNARVGAEAAK